MRRVWLLLACAIASGHAIPGAAAPPAPPTKWLAQDSSGQANAITNGNFGSGDFSLLWSILQDSTIRFTVSKNTTGYIAFGLANSPGVMGPADAYAGWVDSSGSVRALDFSTNQGFINAPDTLQNVANVSGGFANGTLSVTFTRALNTNDTQDKPITPGPMNLIWAWSNTKPSGTTLAKHNTGDVGLAQVVFYSAAALPASPSPSPSPAPAVTPSPAQSSSSLCSGKFCLTWSLGATTIGFTMTMQASGYVAIGFADSAGTMGPADAYAGWVDGSGNVRALDFSTNQGFINAPDTIQNVANVSGGYANGVLSITFTRALNTNDTQDKPITPGPMNLIWAWSNTKPSGTTLTKHNTGDVGLAQVNFFAAAALPASPSPAPAVTPSPAQSSSSLCSGKFCLMWSLGATTIGFTMTIQASGYVAIGFADSAGTMGPADAYAGWVDGSGNVRALDFSTNQGFINAPDTIQNVANVSGSYANGVLSVTFTRALNTNDTQDKPITPGPMNLIWAWSNTKPSGTTLAKHNTGDVGLAQVNFFAALTSPSSLSPVPAVTPSPTQRSSSLCSGKFCLAWSLGATTIGFTMTIQANGYVAIGFADSAGTMGPADAYAGWVDGSGNVRALDFSTNQGFINAPDTIQNVANVTGSFANGVLSITFYRALNTNDTQDKPITPGPMNLIWAWSNTKPSGTTLTKHNTGDVGLAQVNFFAALASPATPISPSPSPSPVPALTVSPTQSSSSFCSGRFCLTWFLGATTIGFQMTIQASGYVAIGFSNTPGAMGPADAYAGWVDTGNVRALDFSTNAGFINAPDAIQNVANVSGSYANGVLSVTFYRALNTNDTQDKPITPGPMNLIWAWSNTKPSGTTLAKHNTGDVGSAQVNFFAGSAGSPAPATPSPSPKAAVAVSPVQTSFCSGAFCLAWFLGQTTIGFKMDIRARGYVAIGFSDTAGAMGPADAYAGYVDNAGNAFVMDFSTTGSRSINGPDTIQNAVNVSGSYTNGVLSITFYRALNTNDPQDKPINPGSMNLIWAWSNTVPTTTARASFTLSKHATSDVGFAQVNFFSGGVSFSNDHQLWIPVTSVAAFVAVILLPGLLGKIFGTGFGSRLDSVLSFRPFPPRGRHWFDTLTLDLFYTAQDMQVGDFLIVALWFPAVLLMLLSPKGNGLGRVCAAAFGTLLLPVTRYSVWAALLGSSFERYIKFHRWAARCTLVIIMSHLIAQCLDKGSNVLTATANNFGYGWVYGLVSFVLMGSMSLFAVEPIRRRFFELFYYTHFLAFPAIALAMMHSYAVCYAMIPSLAMYLIDKAVRFWSTMYKYKILRATPLAGAVRLTVEGPRQKLLRCAPGQYYFVTVPAVSHLQSHPFTVAAITEADDLTFLIRSMGPGTFTNQVCDLASSSSPSYVRLSGPHGSLSLPKPLLDYRVVYLVAGGVGVTPMMCIAQALLQTAPGDMKVVFIWINRQTSAFNEWFPDILVQMMTSKWFDIRLHGTEDPQEKQRGAPVELMVRTNRSEQYDDSPFPPPPSPEPSVVDDLEVAQFRPPIAVGRPDWDATFGPHAADGADVAVLTCGPAPLMTDVQRAAHAHRFHFHKETFAL